VLVVAAMVYQEVLERRDSSKAVAIGGRADETAAMFAAFRRGAGGRGESL